jgi:eukaryotic-like serine/threonine-protein kinase
MTETVSQRERRLLEVIAAYYESAGSGTEPDRRDWLERHPDLASELSDFFAGQDRLYQLAGPVHHREEAGAEPCGLGDYEILRELGRGGIGIVFEARDRTLGRIVALKMLQAGSFASPEDRWRFRNESESVAQLDHSHIIPIYEVGECDGHGYFTMKLMSGGSLADHISEFPNGPARACRLLAAVADGVHHAHRRGILHRDLKPSNVLLDDQGQPYVADFGLAKQVAAGAEFTHSGALLGSPPYMSPEQTSGRRDAVTVATDVYGLGALLYALLTGHPPFRGGSVLETMEQVRDRTPERPSRINPRVDRDLETICLKCLEKDPERRYPSAEAMADDLRRWLAGEPIAARPSSGLDRVRRWCVRPQRIRDTALFLIVLGLTFAVVCAAALAVFSFARSGLEYRRVDTLRVHLVRCIVFYYLPLAVLGWNMLARRGWALWASLVQSIIITTITALSMFNIMILDFGASGTDARVGRFAFELLCVTLFAFATVACLDALIAHYTNQSILRRRGSMSDAGPS